MSFKKYVPNMTEAIKIGVVIVILTVTGIGAMASGKVKQLLRR